MFFFLRYKSDSPFNIINVAIISYSSEIRRVSKLLFFSYAYLFPNFFILIGLVANILLCTPSARVFKIKLPGSQSCLTRPNQALSHPTLTQNLISEQAAHSNTGLRQKFFTFKPLKQRVQYIRTTLGERLKLGQILSRNICWEPIRGTQREYSSKPLTRSIAERILLLKRQIQAYFYPLKIFHLFGFPS